MSDDKKSSPRTLYLKCSHRSCGTLAPYYGDRKLGADDVECCSCGSRARVVGDSLGTEGGPPKPELRLESLHDLAPGTVFRFSDGVTTATISDPRFHAVVCVTHYFIHESGIPDSVSTDKEEAVQVIWRPGDGDRASSEMPSLAEMLEVAKVALGFGQIERTTMHPDGSFESDTTHTVMLAMAAGEFADRLGLDVPAAVMFAMVHDLPEVYADDTCTAWGLTEDEREAKDRREEAATVRLKEQLGPESVVMRTLHSYEQQVQPEARLVRYLDKVLPELTHILNNGDALAAIGMTPDLASRRHDIQRLALAERYPEFVDTVGHLYDEASVAAEMKLSNRHPRRTKK